MFHNFCVSKHVTFVAPLWQNLCIFRTVDFIKYFPHLAQFCICRAFLLCEETCDSPGKYVLEIFSRKTLNFLAVSKFMYLQHSGCDKIFSVLITKPMFVRLFISWVGLPYYTPGSWFWYKFCIKCLLFVILTSPHYDRSYASSGQWLQKNIANSASRILALSSCSVVRRPSSVDKRDIPPYLHYMTF